MESLLEALLRESLIAYPNFTPALKNCNFGGFFGPKTAPLAHPFLQGVHKLLVGTHIWVQPTTIPILIKIFGANPYRSAMKLHLRRASPPCVRIGRFRPPPSAGHLKPSQPCRPNLSSMIVCRDPFVLVMLPLGLADSGHPQPRRRPRWSPTAQPSPAELD